MNKSEFVGRVAEEAGISTAEAGRYLDAFTGAVSGALKEGEPVQITGFGKFYVRERDARGGVNPQTKQKISIPASRVPSFSAGNALKSAV